MKDKPTVNNLNLSSKAPPGKYPVFFSFDFYREVSNRLSQVLLVAGVFFVVSLLSHQVHGETITLKAALKEAVEKGEEAQLLEEKTKRYEAVKKEAWSSAFPQVSAYADVGRSYSTFPIANPPPVMEYNHYSYGVQAQQSLFSFGRLSKAIHVAGIRSQADSYANTRSRQEIELRTLSLFLQIMEIKSRVKILESSIQRQKETVAFLSNNLEKGAGLKAEVLLATAVLKSLEPMRIRVNQGLENTTMQLKVLMGRPLEDSIDIDTSSVYNGVRGVTSESGLYKQALSTRPDLKAMEMQADALDGAATYQKMLYLPSLGAQAKLGITAYDPDRITNWDSRDWSVGIGLNWPLFDGFGLSSRSNQTRSDARSLRLQTQMVRKMIQVEVETGYKELSVADSGLGAAQEALAAAEEARELISDYFKSGSGRLTDLLQAEEALRQAEFAVLEAKNNKLRAQANFTVSLGRSLQEEN